VLFCVVPALTVNSTEPAEPAPRLSPPTTKSVVPARTEGVQVKPVPWLGISLRVDKGTVKDWPPGITPRKAALLGEWGSGGVSGDEDDKGLTLERWTYPTRCE